MQLCTVCEKPVIEHNLLKNVYYCNSARCTRLGLLTVFVLTPVKKPEAPKEEPKKLPVVEPVKNDKDA